MLTRTRTTIIALMASISIGMPAALPGVSHAQRPEGGAHAATCEAYRLATELWEEAHWRALGEGRYDLARYYEQQAIATRALAQIESCVWSGRATHAPVQGPIAKVPGSGATLASAAVDARSGSAVKKLTAKTEPATLATVRRQIAEAAARFSTGAR